MALARTWPGITFVRLLRYNETSYFGIQICFATILTKAYKFHDTFEKALAKFDKAFELRHRCGSYDLGLLLLSTFDLLSIVLIPAVVAWT
jgi:hypothetical protein